MNQNRLDLNLAVKHSPEFSVVFSENEALLCSGANVPANE